MKFSKPGLNGSAMPLEPRVTSVQLLAMISIAIGKTSVASEKNAPLRRKQGQLIATATTVAMPTPASMPSQGDRPYLV